MKIGYARVSTREQNFDMQVTAKVTVLKGMLAKPKKKVSIEQMNKAIIKSRKV